MNIYMPVVRTRAAELRGIRELTNTVKDSLFPIVELTRSRRSSKNPGGAIQKSLDSLLEVFGDRPFVADLTTLESQQNSEFDQLLSDVDGFRNWTDFALRHLPKSCAPVIHLIEPFDERSLRTQISHLTPHFAQVAVRVPTAYLEFPAVISALQAELGSLDRVVLVLDAGYVTNQNAYGAIGRLSEMIGTLGNISPASLSIASSSFPNSVTSVGGGDEHGELMLAEVTVGEALTVLRDDLRYGDYAAIHPLDFVGTVTNWVPRIDVMLDNRFYYYRFRRTAGGYVRAAYEARHDARWVPLQCWAQDNIEATASGEARGLSPSYWIANRINLHITRQVKRLAR